MTPAARALRSGEHQQIRAQQQQDASAPLPVDHDTTAQTDTQSVAADQQAQPGTAQVSESSLTDQSSDSSLAEL